MCGGCGGRDADAGDARPGEAATLGTSPPCPGVGRLQPGIPRMVTHYTAATSNTDTQHYSPHHTYSLYTTISTLLDMFSHAHSSIML